MENDNLFPQPDAGETPSRHMGETPMPRCEPMSHAGETPAPRDDFIRGLLPQLQAVARLGNFTFVSRMQLFIGVHHGLTAVEISDQLEAAFAAGKCGDAFDDVCLSILVTHPGEKLPAPGRSDTMIANGWEVLVAKMEGRRAEED